MPSFALRYKFLLVLGSVVAITACSHPPPPTCPKPGGVKRISAEEDGAFPENVRLGPYELSFPTNGYLDFGDVVYRNKGDVLDYKGRHVLSSDSAHIGFQIFAPDMFGAVFAPSEHQAAFKRGELYRVMILLRWSEDGHPSPYWDMPTTTPPQLAKPDAYGLVAHDLPHGSGKRYFPAETGHAVQAIDCRYTVNGRDGMCTAFRRVRKDMWMWYHFEMPHLVCWRDLDQQLESFFSEVSGNWKPHAEPSPQGKFSIVPDTGRRFFPSSLRPANSR